jgi:acyl-CoA reductase-like NAD-dependent aldehyde dehydrogenase
VVNGRKTRIASSGKGNFLTPTLLDDVLPESEIAQTEILGLVLSLSHAETVAEVIESCPAAFKAIPHHSSLVTRQQRENFALKHPLVTSASTSGWLHQWPFSHSAV